MKVYELTECEEYAFQISHGLYATPELAVEVGKKLCERVRLFDDSAPNHHVSVVARPDAIFVLKGQWTNESFSEWISAASDFWWYAPPFNHSGVFGVFPREVHETPEVDSF